MESHDFDYVLVDGEGLYSYEQFKKMPLRQQAKIVLNEKARFYCNGDPIPKKDALGNKVKLIEGSEGD